MHSFVCLACYYRKFISNFADIAAPLHKATHRDAPVEVVWTDELNSSFETLRNALTSSIVLSYPDFSRKFLLQTDASGVAISSILSQVDDDGNEHPIEYASKLLSSAERNYSNPERECFAALWGMKHFRRYLYGTHFTLVTDHDALRYINSFKDSNMRLLNWSLNMQDFSFDVVHKPGKKHANADALTRMPVAYVSSVSLNSSSILPNSKLTLDAIKSAQRVDKEFSGLYLYLSMNRLPTSLYLKRSILVRY